MTQYCVRGKEKIDAPGGRCPNGWSLEEVVEGDKNSSTRDLPLYASDGAGGYYNPSAQSLVPKKISDFSNVPDQLFYNDDMDALNSLSSTLSNAGFSNDKDDIKSVRGAWLDYLVSLSNSGLQMDPYQALNFLEERNRKLGLSFGSGGSGSGTGGTRFSINLTSKSDAEVLVNSALNTYLGRDATDKEIKQFYKALSVKEKENPSVSQVSGNTVVQKGGNVNPSLEAEKFAEQRDDYADVQAQTTFKRLIEQAVRSRMSGDML